MSFSDRRWRILADDLTGALDTAAAFCGRGDVPVYLAPPSVFGVGPVEAVATGTRDLALGGMAAMLQACLPWFTGPGHRAFKKVDSLLRGNSLAEVAWLLRHGGFDGVVFAPAFPAQGRFTRNGHHWVGQPHAPGVPTDAIRLPDAFASLGLAVHLCQPPDGLPSGGVLMPDVTSDADLARLASLASAIDADRWLWCGSAGLAWALARQAEHAPLAGGGSSPGLTHLVTASRHPVLRGQLQRLEATGVRCEDLASPHPLPAEAAEAALREHTRRLVATLPRPDNLVVVGGDTLLALCRAAGVQGLQAGPGPRGGWGAARLQGGVWHGVTCYSRSGAFGAPDDLSALLATLTVTSTEKEHTA
ncbi:hypothetical protein RD110_05575 [Rhodoferax koreense]|uniref:Four-carbon acid sugar kinase N-terminal domain-containing protein n=1 Tax=Rhodoferax koreensis TaxID=1842727 RepID=A0A1P8JSK0_9BURK|nr:four-carbon acid sugar kinase family protein [Rhodoferax koreense]APW36726.1 hypothetical protein RD110_05575 [Rhodoferax koreense]